MLNDLKTKLGSATFNRKFALIYLRVSYRNQELENRKAGRLPPAFGSTSMLELAGRSRTDRLDPLTKFKLFECDNTTGPLDSIPEGTAPSRSCNTPRVNSSKTVAQFPPLPANEALAEAVFLGQLPMNGWAPRTLFNRF